MDDFIDFLKFGIGGLTAILLGLFIFIACLYLLGEWADYKLDKTICDVYVQDDLVHTGYCHFISISSIGENGNTKHLAIYKDIIKCKPLKHYIDENIKVKVRNEN